jgi:hypothetical protein
MHHKITENNSTETQPQHPQLNLLQDTQSSIFVGEKLDWHDSMRISKTLHFQISAKVNVSVNAKK